MIGLYDKKQSFIPAEATLREHVLFFYAHAQDLAARFEISTDVPGWGNNLMTRIEQMVNMLDEHSEAILQPKRDDLTPVPTPWPETMKDIVFSAIGLEPVTAGEITRRIGVMYPGFFAASTTKNPRALVATYLSDNAGRKRKWIERVGSGLYQYNPETSEAPSPPIFVQRGKP